MFKWCSTFSYCSWEINYANHIFSLRGRHPRGSGCCDTEEEPVTFWAPNRPLSFLVNRLKHQFTINSFDRLVGCSLSYIARNTDGKASVTFVSTVRGIFGGLDTVSDLVVNEDCSQHQNERVNKKHQPNQGNFILSGHETPAEFWYEDRSFR